MVLHGRPWGPDPQGLTINQYSIMRTALITLTVDGKIQLHKGSELPYSEAKAEFNKLSANPPKGAQSITLWPSTTAKAVEFDDTGRKNKFFKKPIDPKSPEAEAAAKVDAAKKAMFHPIPRPPFDAKEEAKRAAAVDAQKAALRKSWSGSTPNA